jgi:hypothetical protein
MDRQADSANCSRYSRGDVWIRPESQALQKFSAGPMIRDATRATGGQFIVATFSYSMSIVVRPLLTFKHPQGSYLYLCSHSITSLVMKYLG